MRAVNLWSAVKHWEIMQEFNLEEVALQVYPQGERGWVGTYDRTLFEPAPHRSANNSFNFKFQDRVAGSYFNTAWYQLQMIVNSGHREPHSHYPMDWKYHPNHLWHASNESGQWHSLRYVQSLIKMQQMLDNDKGPHAGGWWLWHTNPYWIYTRNPHEQPRHQKLMTNLNEYEPGLQKKLAKPCSSNSCRR